MRLSLATITGILALTSHLGVDARAIRRDETLTPVNPADARLGKALEKDHKHNSHILSSPRAVTGALVPVVKAPPTTNKNPLTNKLPNSDGTNTNEVTTVEPEIVEPEPVKVNEGAKPATGAKPNEPTQNKPKTETGTKDESCAAKVRRGELDARMCSGGAKISDPSKVKSVEELMEMLDVPESHFAFYSGPKGTPYVVKVTQFINMKIRSGDRGWKYITTAIKPEHRDYQDQFTGEATTVLDKRLSEAVAKKTSGVAYVVMAAKKDGETVTDFNQDSTWAKHEYNNLGDAVTKIVRVTADTWEEEEMPKYSGP